MYQRIFLGLAALFLGPLGSHGQALGPPARADSIVVAKAFPLLALFGNEPALGLALQADPGLRAVARRQAARTYRALRRGPAAGRRYADSLAWQPAEIKAIGQRLVTSYQADQAVRAAVAPLLGPAGRYPLYAGRPDTAALRLAWQDAAQGLNRILRVYVAGDKPKYAAIDSTGFRRDDPALLRPWRTALLPASRRARRRPGPYFALPLRAALLALRLNDRLEAARYEPLLAGDNRAPAAAVARTDWARYPYSVILVPGHGPDEAGVALDSVGARRCRLAAARYRRGQAPFVLVSGGHVHPNRTPYCEAVEMKKYLVDRLGLPGAAVLVEPHARHTTTNLRNAARLLCALGAPADRPLLTVTDAAQSAYIATLAARCQQELGYVPYRDLRVVSDQETTCFPVPDAGQPDPLDPLDP